MLSEVTSLKHEVLDDAMETRAFIAVAVLASGQLTEVSSSPGNYIIVELEDDSLLRLAADGDVKLGEVE